MYADKGPSLVLAALATAYVFAGLIDTTLIKPSQPARIEAEDVIPPDWIGAGARMDEISLPENTISEKRQMLAAGD